MPSVCESEAALTERGEQQSRGMMQKVLVSAVAWLAGAVLALGGTEKVDVEKAEKLIGEKVQLLDVRTEEEWNEGHLAGAVRVDFRKEGFGEAVARELDEDKPVLIYCRSGNRSGQAAKLMEGLGFKSLFDLKGGIIAWKEAEKEVVK